MRKTISPILMFLLTLLGGVSAWAHTTWYSPGSRLSIENITEGSLNGLSISSAPSEGVWNLGTKWYSFRINGQYIETTPGYCDESDKLLANKSATSNGLGALWAVVGDENNGYQFYNLTAGPGKVLGLTGSEQNARCAMVDASNAADNVTTRFDITYKTDGWFIKKHSEANNYLNIRGDYLALWNTAYALDADGSKVQFAEITELSEYVTNAHNTLVNRVNYWKKVPAIWENAAATYTTLSDYSLPTTIDNSNVNNVVAKHSEIGTAFINAVANERFTAKNGETNTTHVRYGKYMYVGSDNTAKGHAPTYTFDEVMTIKPNKDLTFKLYNATADKYIGKPTGSSSGSTSAVIFSKAANFDLYTSSDFNDNVVVFRVNGTATMHLLGVLNISAYSSTTDPGSHWLLSKDLSRHELNAALAVPSLIGPGLGHYTYKGDDSGYQQTISSAQSLLNNANATDEQIQSSIDALNTISQKTSINQPEVGKLYRFKGKVSGKYMASPSNKDSKMKLYAPTANGAETVFWLKENESGDKILQSFGNGYYVTDTHTANAQKASANTITFIAAESGNPGYYTLKTSYSSPYMYDDNKDTEVDRNSTYVANNCDWQIEEVTWLPIPVTNGYSQLGTFVSPVALKAASAGNYAKGGRLKFFTGKIDGNYFRVSEYKEDVIPANTPFLIEYQNGSAYENGCSYLQISDTDGTVPNNNDLEGGLETVATPTNQGTIYTLQKTGEDPANDKQEFRIYTGTNIKGFRAYLPVPNGTPIRGMIFGGQTTDIEGAPTGETAAPIVYDLSGRRVQHATKGMYIVNGKKMYVK